MLENLIQFFHRYSATLLKLKACIVLVCLPVSASAHLVDARFGEFYNGMLHPLTTLMHLIPWLALGFLAGLQTLSLAKKVLLTFPIAVVVGAALTNFFSLQLDLAYFNLASILILGFCLVFARPLPSFVIMAFSGVFGLSHGLANANIELSGNGQLLYLSGVVLAAYFVICFASAIAIWMKQKPHWGKVALRTIGSWIVAIGVIFGGFSILNLSV